MNIATRPRRRQLLRALPALALASLVPSHAAAARAIQDVSGATTLRLEGGEEVLLSGVHVPEAYQDAAVEVLRRAVRGRALKVVPEERPTFDRGGRALARVEDRQGRTAQTLLLRNGLALVDPSPPWPEPRPGLAGWFAAERGARDAQTGLWASALWPVAPEDAARQGAGFALARGAVVSVNARRSFTYLNFSERWRESLSVRVPSKSAKALLKSGLDLERLVGEVVEIRGWLFKAGGAMIEASEAAQLDAALGSS